MGVGNTDVETEEVSLSTRKTHFVPFLYRWQRGTEAGIYFTIPLMYEPLLSRGKGAASVSFSAKKKLSVDSNVILYYNWFLY